jgi:hypothetical protein
MQLIDILYAAGAVIISLGGGAFIVGLLGKWLGELWAKRILDQERENAYRDRELLIRRRDVYRKLSTSMRIFVDTKTNATEPMKKAFLEAYDEAALWASENAISVVGTFLDMIVSNTANPGSISQQALKAAYAHCITVMRKDSGFSETTYHHRVVSF